MNFKSTIANLTVIGLLIGQSLFAQNMILTVDATIDSHLFSASDSIINPDFEILELSGYQNIDEPRYKLISSTCLVNNDPLRVIHFATGKLNGDTLIIELLETNPLYHHRITIDVLSDEVNVKFEMNQSGPAHERTYINESAEVTLSSNAFLKGKWVYGKLLYKSTMVIDGHETPLIVDGYFKANLE